MFFPPKNISPFGWRILLNGKVRGGSSLLQCPSSQLTRFGKLPKSSLGSPGPDQAVPGGASLGIGDLGKLLPPLGRLLEAEVGQGWRVGDEDSLKEPLRCHLTICSHKARQLKLGFHDPLFRNYPWGIQNFKLPYPNPLGIPGNAWPVFNPARPSAYESIEDRAFSSIPEGLTQQPSGALFP